MSRSTQQLNSMDFNLDEPERICNKFLYCHARRKNHYHDFVTYLKVLSNGIAWTSTWMNQEGYVTTSYNCCHAQLENHYHDFVTYPKVLSN